MQPADDVELARWRAIRRFRLREDLVQAHRVCVVGQRTHTVGAEDAHPIQDAHVGRIDVLVRHVEHAVPVHPSVHEVRHSANRKQVVGLEQSDRIVSGNSLALLDLFGNRKQGLRARADGQLVVARREDHSASRARTASVTL